MTCPALHILRGTLGPNPDGTPREPRHVPMDHYPGTCRHCKTTIKETRR